MFRHRLLILSLAGVLVAACAGTTPASTAPTAAPGTAAPSVDASAAPSEPATPQGSITVMTLQGAQADAMAAIIPEFEAAYPGVTVTLNATTDTDIRNNSARLYASADTPDVGWTWNDARIYPGLVANGVLEPINDVWEAQNLEAAYSDTVKDLYTEDDGNRYAVNTDFVWAPVTYYNKDLFAQAGVEAPDGRVASIAEWDDIVATLKEAGIAPLTAGVGDRYPAKHIADQLMTTATTTEQFAEYLTNWKPGNAATVHYDTEPYLSVLRTIADWQADGVFAEGTAAATADQSLALFLAGGAAMMSGGSWHPGILDAQGVTFEYGWFLLPSLGVQPSPFLAYAGNAYVVPKAGKNKDLAKLFIGFLMDPATQTDIIPAFGVPARQDIDTAAIDVHPMLSEMLTRMSEFGVSTLWGDVVPPALGEAAGPLYADLLTGAKTPEEVGAEFESIAEQLRAGG